jgi:hypothetical protein
MLKCLILKAQIHIGLLHVVMSTAYKSLASDYDSHINHLPVIVPALSIL